MWYDANIFFEKLIELMKRETKKHILEHDLYIVSVHVVLDKDRA